MALAGAAVVDAYSTSSSGGGGGTQRKNIIRDAISSSPASESLTSQMDEDDLLRSLLDDGFNRRSEVLERIRRSVRISSALPFSDKPTFFRALNRALADGNWDVRHQCILLLAEVVPLLGASGGGGGGGGGTPPPAVDECVALVLVRLIACVGDSKITVRRVVIQALHTYMRHTASVGHFLRQYVTLGLENVDARVRREAVIALPLLLTTEFAGESYADVIAGLCHKLDGGMRPEDVGVQRAVLVTLDRLRELVGEARFREQLASCGQLVRECYCRAVAVDFGKAGAGSGGSRVSGAAAAADEAAATGNDGDGSPADDLELGILPAGLLAQLNADRDDFRARAQAAERLKEALERLPRGGGGAAASGSSSAVARHLGALLSVVGSLLDDANFRVVTLALDALAVLIERVGRDARPHVRAVVAALTRRMGDNKAVVRSSVARTALQLMQSLGPQPVLAALAENTGHRNSRVRAETLNLLIAALLTFPSTDIDLPAACSNAACCLADARRAVRHAALECVAVLAQCLGPARSAPLARAVEAVELHYDGHGVADAVAARLSRRVLPRRDADGLVEYALQLPTGSGGGSGAGGTAGKAGGGGAGSAMPPGADIDWVMAGSGAGGGGGSSARSIRLEDLEVTAGGSGQADVTASPPSKKQSPFGGAAVPAALTTSTKSTPRGSKLPWGDNFENGGSMYSSMQLSQVAKDLPNGGAARALPAPAAAPPRQTWTDAVQQQQQQTVDAANGTASLRKVVRRPSNGATPSGDAHSLISNGATESYNDGEASQTEIGTAVRGAVPASPAAVGSQQATARPTFSKAPPKGAAAAATAAAATVAAAAGSGAVAATLATKGPPDIRGDLSSSWPGNKRFAGSGAAATGGDESGGGGGGNGTLGRRPILDPISAPETPLPSQQPSPAWGGDAEDRRGRTGRDVEPVANDDAPVPVKPKLVRSASRGRALAAAAATNNGAKMPPIQPLPPERSSSPRRDGIGIAGPTGADDTDSAYGTIDLDYDTGDAQDGLMSSLNKIRHSASKKKAEKLFRKLELKQSISSSIGGDGSPGAAAAAAASPPTSSPEPAAVAAAAVTQATPSSSRSNPFEAKAKLARRSSNQARAAGSPVNAGDDAGSSGAAPARNEPVRPEYNPLAGVTFRRGGEQADGVSIVGRGYGDDAGVADSKPAILAPNKSQREKRRTGIATIAAAGGKGPRLSPLAIAAMPASAQDDEHVTIVGHGMFDGAGGGAGGGGSHGAVATEQHHQLQQQHAQQVMTTRSLALAASSLKGTDPGLIPVHAIATGAAFRPAASDYEGFAGEDASGDEVLLAPALRDQMAVRRKKTEEAAVLRRRQQLQQQQEDQEPEGVNKVDRRWPDQQEHATTDRRRRTEPAMDKRPRLAADRRPAAEDDALDGDALGHETAAGGSGSLVDDGRAAPLLVAGVSPSKAAAAASVPDFSKPPTGKRSQQQQQQTPARRRTASPAGFTSGAQPLHSAGGGSQEELSPLPDPDAALHDAYRLLADDDWNAKYDGLMMVRRLAAYHDDVLREQAHTVTIALVKEVQNLRSQVARLAIVALGDMFTKLQRVMDAELDATAKILLHKNGESNEFIRVELEKSLRVMVEETTPQRALTAVINGGASHKNQAVRRVVVQLLDTLAEKLGPDRLLSGVKDLTDRFLPVIAQLTTDPSPETRWYARKVILSLMDHQDFERALVKFLSPTVQRSVKDVCEGLRAKGLGDMPMDAPSAKGRRSGIVSRSRTSSSDSIPLLGVDTTTTMTGGSAGSSKVVVSVSATPPAVRKALFRVGDDELVKQLCATLTASDWQQRYDGIDQLADLCDSNPDLVANHIVRIFDKFIPLLRDSNSKVNLHALRTLSSRMLAPLAGSMGQVTSLAVQTAAANLASKNREVCDAASDLLDDFVRQLDNALLIQPFANQATVCTPKVKPPLIAHVQLLAERVYPRKPKHVVLHVLPLLWHLLSASGSSGEVRRATAALVAVLHRLMGADLVDEAAGNSLVSAACVRLLREMIEGAAAATEPSDNGYRVT